MNTREMCVVDQPQLLERGGGSYVRFGGLWSAYLTIRSGKLSHLVLDIPYTDTESECTGFFTGLKVRDRTLDAEFRLSRESLNNFVFHCTGWETELIQVSA